MIVAVVVAQLIVLALAVRADYARWHASRSFASISVRPPDIDAPYVGSVASVARHHVRRLDDDYPSRGL